MLNKIGILFVLCFSLFTGVVHSQQIRTDHVDFDSGLQNMWGESWNAFSINKTITLFEVPWDVSINEEAIVDVAGADFGFGIDAGFSGKIGSKISLEGFTTGEVQVKYPIDVRLDMNTDLAYDSGDPVKIATSYTVTNPGYELKTLYPALGEFKWDIYFQMAANATAKICFISCTTFPIIPSFDTGLININLATASGTGATTGGNTGVWWLGAGDPAGGPAQPGIAGWPFAMDPQYSGPFSLATLGVTWIPWQCHVPAFPAEFEGPFGFSAVVTLPYVITDNNLTGPTSHDLRACGDSTYLSGTLELFKLIGGILEYSPPPGPAVGVVLSNLSGSQSLGPASVNWNFMSADFTVKVTNKQCFDFKPKVWGRFEYPVPVDYQIWDGAVLSGLQTSSIINVELGDEIRYKFPCYFEDLHITPTYYIDGNGNNFTNHTYDSISVEFNMSALEFGVTIPGFVVVPEINVPEICLDIPYPCPTWSKPWKWCTERVCTPAFTIPEIGWSAQTWGFGPIFSLTAPIADVKYDWYLHSWNLAGFSPAVRDSFTMTARPLRIELTSQTDVLCFGGSTGAIDVTTDVGAYSIATPYSFTWTNGATSTTTPDLTNLTAGNYDLVAIDVNNCETFVGATILEPAQPLSITYTSVNDSCNGGNTGAIDILVQGGTPGTTGYTYSWTGPAGYTSVIDDISGLAAGSYAITVTDSSGCTKMAAVTISEPNLLGQVAAITDVNCNGDADGMIAVDVLGGTLPYEYSWVGPAGYTSTLEDISLLSGGNYTLTITDGNKCTSVETYTVNEPAAPISLSITGVDVACKYDSTGSITLTTSGGTPGYSYLWSVSTGVVLPYITENLSNLPAETYSVIVTDSKGCQEQISQMVNEPTASLASSELLTNISCFGGADGVIDPVVSGGTLPYTYAWSNASAGPVATGLIAGVYTLTITDGNGCTELFTYELTEPSQPLSIMTIGKDVLCKGDNTGSILIEVSGGTTDYTYIWNNGLTIGSISDLLAGTYDLIVTDANGCVETSTVIIDEPLAPLTSTSTVVDVDCYGNNSGSIDLTPAGGTVPYAYEWSNGSSVVMNTIDEDVLDLWVDSYTSIVTDYNGCTNSLTTIINGPAAPLAISGVVNDVNCYGLNDGEIDIAVSGGTSGYTYSWSNGAVSQDLTAIVAGTYTVTVTDANACQETMSFDVIEPHAPLFIELSSTDVLCFGDAVGTIQSEVLGGTMPYTYLWSNGEVTADVETLVAGPYTLTVTDDQGCTAFSGAVIKEPAAPLTFVPTVVDASCYTYGDGQIEIAIAGGTQPYYFNWGDENDILLNNASETLTDLFQGDYFIRVTDDNGCITEQLVTVNEPAPFVATSIISDALCFEEATGAIDLTLVGGTLPYSVVWDNGALTEDLTNILSGTYTFISTDNQGCVIEGEYFVDQPTIIDITEEIIPLTCIDQSDAAILIYPYGGTSPYNYLWSNGEVTQNIEGLLAGQFNVIVGDANGCAQTFDFEIYSNDEECIGIPNTFTPNGDDYNDTWLIRNIDLYPNASVKVFNRWGNEIYVSEGAYKPWDGIENGKPLPSAVYYYIIVLDNELDNKYTGTITIIR